MTREIDLLLDAAGKDLLIVDKDSNVLLDWEGLLEISDAGRFRQPDSIAPPDERSLAVSDVFPGCQQLGSGGRGHVLVGQTEHFLLFAGSRA